MVWLMVEAVSRQNRKDMDSDLYLRVTKSLFGADVGILCRNPGDAEAINN